MPIDKHRVRLSASLCAFTKIGAASPGRLRGEALPRPCDAHGPVHERLQLSLGFVSQPGDFGKRKLARHNDAFQTEHSGQVAHGCRGHQGHLRGCVDRQVRGELVCQTRDSEAPHEYGIDTGVSGVSGGGQDPCDVTKLVCKHEDVEGQEAVDPAGAQPWPGFRERFDVEILGSCAGIERPDTNIDGIGTIGEGDAYRLWRNDSQI